ncbi:MAG: 50S ribosomal protein L11 methyltransferase [Acidobacteriota bacterium]
MKVWHSIEVEFARAAESAATTPLWARQTTGGEVSEDPARPDEITLRAYFDTPPDAAAIRAAILNELGHQGVPATALHRVESLTIADQDWLAEWKKGYEPVEIGERLLICPSWKREKVAGTSRLIIEIDPGMAFGTGTHETTRGCLEMIEKYWQGGSLLDVGTGTGILARAAARLHPGARVVGFDNDPEAIEVANENAAINGLTDDLELEVNRLSAYAGQEFDLVVANLTADVIIPLAADFPTVMRPGSFLILSGILREQEEQVKKALDQFTWREAKPDNEWVTLVCQL